MDTHQDRINSLAQGILNLQQNDTVTLTFIVIHMAFRFQEIKASDILSETFLPQIEVLCVLLELKTEKTFETILTELDTMYS
jgi:hypothetical protein